MDHPLTSPPPAPTRPGRAHQVALAILGAAAVSLSAVSLPAIAPASAATPPTLQVLASTTLTLPSDDGFNDAATLQVRSNSKLIVRASIIDRSTGDLVDTIDSSVALAKHGSGYSADITVSDDGLDAGRYLVRVTDRDDDEVTDDTPLTIGSGKIAAVGLSTTEKVLYPLKDGYLDTLHASVSAKDETGTELPVSGTVTVTSGTKKTSKTVESTSELVTLAKISVTGLPSGQATVRARVTGPAGGARQSPSKTLSLKGTRVTAVSLNRSSSVVNPITDGYRDSVAITFSSATSIPKAIPVTGTITIRRNGVTAKSWKLDSSARKVVTWNGRVGSRVVARTYTVTAKVKGKEGPAVKTSTEISVSRKQLHRDSATVWRSAKQVLEHRNAYDAKKKGGCSSRGGKLDCTGYDASKDNSLSLYAWGTIAVPDKVRASAVFRTPTLRVTAVTSALSGSAKWSFGSNKGRTGTVKKGSSTLPWLPLNGNPSTTTVSMSFRKNTTATIDKFRVQYNYTVLR